MHYKILLALFIVAGCYSCSNNRQAKHPAQSNQTPKVLQENNEPASEVAFSKKRGEDILESLYQEQLSKSEKLLTLETAIAELESSKADSAKAFNDFNDKNQAYFAAAKGGLNNIRDSLIRSKIEQLLTEHINAYSNSTEKNSRLIKQIEFRQITVEDLHFLLKLVKTLPLMKKYQQSNKPGTGALEGYLNQQDKVIKELNIQSGE